MKCKIKIILSIILLLALNFKCLFLYSQFTNWVMADTSFFGILDVTAPPFNADPTGKKDCTHALQAAIDSAQAKRMVAFFPPGVYKVSNTLYCRQSGIRETYSDWDPIRYSPVVLMGSRAGKTRPKIVLAPNSPEYNDPDKPKLVLYYHMGGKLYHKPPKYPQPGPGLIGNKFIGIDIEIGKGNSGAVAIRMRGAQGTVIEDATINTTYGKVGIEGAGGSGGSYTNVTVIGGKIGLDASTSLETPGITGLSFINQTEHAILYFGRQTLVGTGIKIHTKYPITAVFAEDLWTSKQTSVDNEPGIQDQKTAWNGQACFVDSEIVFTDTPGIGIRSNASVYLNNVFIKNANILINHTEQGKLSGKQEKWMHIKEYAQGYTMHPFAGYQFSSPIYIDREKKPGIINVIEGNTPPEDLQSRHVWDENFPSWESPGTVNVKQAPYFARGDGITDDTEAIQRAIDENEIVFIPKGLYRITRTIDLKSDTKLIGLAPHLSVLAVAEPEGSFADENNPQPILRTADDALAKTVIAFLGTWNTGNGAYNLLWRSGRHSIIRNRLILHESPMMPIRTHNSNIVTGNGGGKWYNFHETTWNLYHMIPSYRHLYVEGTSEPFRIYQCNPEHARSDANMEIKTAENITLYGVKSEGNYPVILIRHSNNIRMFGYGGSAPPWPNNSLFLIEYSKNILFSNVFDMVRLPHDGMEFLAGYGQEPTVWHTIIERFPDGSWFKTKPSERPVLYKSGNPFDLW